MMARQNEVLFPVLEELNIGFVEFSPMVNGFLTGKYNKDSKFDAKTDYRSMMPQFKEEAYEQNKKLLQLLWDMAAEKNATPAQISLAWMICKKDYIAPIPGTTKLVRLEENAKAADIQLTQEEIKNLDEVLASIKMSEVFGGTKIVK